MTTKDLEKTIHVRVPPQLRTAIERLAARNRRALSDQVRVILEDALHEDNLGTADAADPNQQYHGE
jgi:hypothetical protein